MKKVAQYKKDVVKKLSKQLEESPIIGVLNMENLPASALQVMRGKLRGKAEMFMTKKRFMKIAFEEAEKKRQGLSVLVPHLKGMPALMFTKDNPFAIYKLIKKSKSPAYAKAGQTAPRDLIAKAGPTPFAPGPVIGELGALGIKAGVEAGKVAIKADKVLTKEGEVITDKVASLLMRLDVKPMEIGLDITAILENGTVYARNVLDIDEDRFMADLSNAAAWSRNLAMEMAYPAKDIIEDLLALAYRESKALGTEANILSPDMMPDLLAKAHMQMNAVKKDANL